MNNKEIIEKIKSEKLIVIVRGVSKDKIVSLASAMIAGGINCMEITVDQKSTDGNRNTLDSISLLCDTFGDKLLVGAGTVMTASQVQSVVKAGAKYIISPNVCKAVIDETKKFGIVSIPGAFTPSEAADAYDMGADFVKIFPVSALGSGYLKAISAPLSHIPLLAVGGVRPEEIKNYSEAGACGFGVGGDLVNKSWINEGKFDLLEAEAKRYRSAVEAL